MDRAAEKLTPEKVEKWVGEKERYFYRVAYYILLEDRDKGYLEIQMPDRFDVTSHDNEDLEPESQCLGKCLQKLSTSDRELIERYYRGDKSIKRENRVELAQDLKIDLPGLRVRALRIRRELRKCIERCLRQADRLLTGTTYGLAKTQRR
ncbi:MAG TPA: hypothetical protein VLB46_04380 [Pyrinomonadaceae bacterium]|nr:hypothetical protein [Pyrinomonadaceae bacterium]